MARQTTDRQTPDPAPQDSKTSPGRDRGATPLRKQHCVPCSTGDRLARKDIQALLAQVPGWDLQDERLVQEMVFRDFDQAMRFLDGVAGIAREEDHHPDLHLTDYNHVRIELTTHKADGLTRNDFILADRIDGLLEAQPPTRRPPSAR